MATRIEQEEERKERDHGEMELSRTMPISALANELHSTAPQIPPPLSVPSPSASRRPTSRSTASASASRNSKLRPPSRPASLQSSLLLSSREHAWHDPLSSDVYLSRPNPELHPLRRTLFMPTGSLVHMAGDTANLAPPFSPSEMSFTSRSSSSSSSSSSSPPPPSFFFRPSSSPSPPSSDSLLLHRLDPHFSSLWHSDHHHSVSNHNESLPKLHREYFDTPQPFPCWRSREETWLGVEEKEGEDAQHQEGGDASVCRLRRWRRAQPFTHHHLKFHLTDPQLQQQFTHQQQLQQQQRQRIQKGRFGVASWGGEASLHDRSVAALGESNTDFQADLDSTVPFTDARPFTSSSSLPNPLSSSPFMSGASPLVQQLNSSRDRFDVHTQLTAAARMDESIGGGGGTKGRRGTEAQRAVASPRTRRLALHRVIDSDPAYRVQLEKLEKSWNTRHAVRNEQGIPPPRRL